MSTPLTHTHNTPQTNHSPQSLGYVYARERVRAWREAQKKGGAGVLGGQQLSFRVGDMVRGRSLTALDEFNSVS